MEIESVLGLSHYKPQRLARLDRFLNKFHFLRNHGCEYSLVRGGNRHALGALVISEERGSLHVAQLRAHKQACDSLIQGLKTERGWTTASGMRHPEDQRRLSTLQVLFVKVKDLSEVHRLELFI